MGAIAEDVRRSGTLAAVNDAVSLNQPGTAVIAINLVVTGSNTTVFEASVDEGASPTWVAIKAINVNSGSLVASATASGLFKVDNAGYRQFRVRCSIFASGSVVVVMNGSASPSAPGLISAAAGGAGAATIADGADIAEGATTDAAVTGDNSGTVSAKLRGLTKIFADVWDSTNHWLQVKLMAGAAVIGAVTQSGTWTVQPGNTANTTAWKVDNSAVTQPVSATSLPLPTGAAADASLSTINTTLGTLTTTTDFDAKIGSVTETAPATDTASSGLNGRLQRAAQRITSLIALLPTALVSNRLDVNLGAAPALVTVQGDAATGAALAGNPVRVGISDATSAQDWRQMVFTTGNAATGYPGVALLASNGTTLDPVKNDGGGANASLRVNIGSGGSLAAVGALADGNGSAGVKVFAAQMGFNGTTNDNLRNNTTNVVQASTLTTVQTINTDITNFNGRAFMAHANVTIYNGGSILMKLQWKDANGLFVDIPGATTGAVTSGADVILNVGPTVWPANSATVFNVNWFVPRLIRLVTTIATASVTFSQSYDLPAN